MPPSLDALLTDLEAAKNRFGQGTAAETRLLLDQVSKREFRDANSLIRFHEALLFLRAFPQSLSSIPRVEKALDKFHERIDKLRGLGGDMSAFDDFDTSGIAGTTMQDSLNFEVARWLIQRVPRNVEIAWEDYDDERAMGSTWPRFVPLLQEDSDVEANVPWRRWLDAARGRERDLEWIIHQVEQLDATDRARAELYDSLRLPLRWHLHNLKLSRTRNWHRPRHFYIHSGPLITRKEVSLADELSKPSPKFSKLSRRDGESTLQKVREVMVVRYRELYGTTLGDPGSVVRAEVGRGVTIYLWNLPPGRRLPLRAYVAGFTLKNGVPINYIEAIGLCDWIEVGFNTFYTYRQGETAWIYAQALRCLCACTGAKTISVYPYQIGQNNDEALDSGAFWFYRKLGFRSGREDIEHLARREEQKIAASPKYRTSRKTLKRLAQAHVFYELERIEKRRASSRIVTSEKSTPASSAEAIGGPWDRFSTRNLALRANRRMARECDGELGQLGEVSVREVSRALGLNPARLSAAERQSLENWALILALIPGLAEWSSQEKRNLIEMIRSQSGRNEMRYLRQTQRQPRLRDEILRLGSG
jgi:hypothetical protein